jgi:hypothetical protein
MIKSTAIVLAVAGLVATGVGAAILNQQDGQRRAQGAPSLTGSTLIMIDQSGAHACSQWAAASSNCVRLESEEDGAGQAD